MRFAHLSKLCPYSSNPVYPWEYGLLRAGNSNVLDTQSVVWKGILLGACLLAPWSPDPEGRGITRRSSGQKESLNCGDEGRGPGRPGSGVKPCVCPLYTPCIWFTLHPSLWVLLPSCSWRRSGLEMARAELGSRVELETRDLL